jgi:hypothetical protein
MDDGQGMRHGEIGVESVSEFCRHLGRGIDLTDEVARAASETFDAPPRRGSFAERGLGVFDGRPIVRCSEVIAKHDRSPPSDHLGDQQ